MKPKSLRIRFSAHKLSDGTFLILEAPDPQRTYEGIPQEPRVVFTVPHVVGIEGENPYTAARAERLVTVLNACEGIADPSALRTLFDLFLQTFDQPGANPFMIAKRLGPEEWNILIKWAHAARAEGRTCDLSKV